MKDDQLVSYLLYLKLSYFREHHQSLAKEAAEKNWTQLDFLSRLVEGEALQAQGPGDPAPYPGSALSGH